MSKVTIDVVTESPNGMFALVLVEQGPWATGETDSQLRRLQERLYDVVDVAVDGRLIDKYPRIKGAVVTIRVDCYDTPREETEQFVRKFGEHVRSNTEIQDVIRFKGLVQRLEFEYNWRALQ